MAKTNGTSKRETTTPSTTVKKQLAKEATGQAKVPVQTAAKEKQQEVKFINLDDRIKQFEKLRGLANQRERLVNTLSELTRFNYNQAESSTFSLKDASGLEFQTTNSNLIKLVATELQKTLETRKEQLEKDILAFNL
ncbi:hypothetical protein GCM10011344_42890 [Dokdonia pacifica]|uniref:Uncharacterized protein n=1 Tax=Dokdonia pacifica TaxID=1627892 RepID=A0A239AIT5_9FLAO|nr:hypothetical protein [Dokdonia pacifica]GGG37474.1 hypothetical protein GCM10011344_42890 [Dokdonia pacifica]SNR94944.1 hypothetical protein SAMN06265376_104435 [Dokdonia pacifica]